MDDWFGVVSWGAYPTPGVTAAQRMALAVTYGLWFGALPAIAGWQGKVNTIVGASIASVNTILRADISKINTV